MALAFFALSIIFFPFIIAALIFGVEYMYIPPLRIALIVMIAGIYLWFSTFRKKYSDRHNGYFEDINLMSGMIEGTTYYYTLGHKKDDSVVSISISIENIYGYDFSLKFETPFERFFKSLGLSTECQSGDSRFDETIYIISDDEWLCNELSNNKSLREALYSLFWSHHEKGIKVQKIECFDGRFLLKTKNTTETLSDDQAKGLFKTIVPLMKQAIEHLPSKAAPHHPIYREYSGKIAFVFHTLIVALIVNGGMMLYFEHNNYLTFPQLSDSYSILPMGIAVTIISLVAIIVIVYKYLRQSSRFSPVLFELFTLGSLGLFLSALVEIKEVNVYLDSSDATTFASSITSKEIHSGRKKSTTYFLNLYGWNNQPMQHRIQIDSTLYHQYNENDHIRVYLHKGFLGYPWVEKIEQITN
ncbi:MAG: hypothetical protein PHI47_05070 [Sulfuricurvum sp.]|uniref:hypothetical protein n=1 Tax=Sulfuricurvum sp. TaxID=2025608 RepID=UPI002629985C|nr:hypothetical protein [Sulfuricurvum sp.]MDD5159399.1 hypothetical protein [Sulfuricurvum sp.]